MIAGTWTLGGKYGKFGYDFWYQPYHDTLVSTEWAPPKIFKRGFDPAPDLQDYGTCLNFYSWSKRELKQVIDLGTDGCAPLEVRFLHNPKSSVGYVGCAVNANVFKYPCTHFILPTKQLKCDLFGRFDMKADGTWFAEKVIDVKPKKVSGWIGTHIQGRIYRYSKNNAYTYKYAKF